MLSVSLGRQDYCLHKWRHCNHLTRRKKAFFLNSWRNMVEYMWFLWLGTGKELLGFLDTCRLGTYSVSSWGFENLLDDPIKTNHSSSIYRHNNASRSSFYILPFKVTHNTQIPRTYTSFLQGSHLYKKQNKSFRFFWHFRRLNKAILSAKLFAKTYYHHIHT